MPFFNYLRKTSIYTNTPTGILNFTQGQQVLRNSMTNISITLQLKCISQEATN